jgi:prolyl-tRNA synthetase
MRMSKLFLPTLREVPADANVISHQLMLRAGLIRKVASGIYTFLPLGLRVIKKISSIIEQEMNRAGGQEILMPMVQPAELWQESGRFNEYGPELLRFKDRKDSWFCLGPTHEEVVTALVRDHIKSYKNLPLILYQIQTKFRDEIRPRFGLIRGREFIMKDAYSFCADKASQDGVYQSMWDAYHRIFTRCGLQFRAVKAATGSIGGDMSHEFQVLAQSGEDAIATCDECGYAANVELAEIKVEHSRGQTVENYKEIKTPDKITVADQAQYLGIDENKIIKSLAYDVDGCPYLVLVKGGQQVSDAKLKTALGAQVINLIDEESACRLLGPRGFIGPVNLSTPIKIIADFSLKGCTGLIAGANKKDTHFAPIDVDRDINAEFFDLRQASENDPCGQCGAPFKILRGIEVGHIFYLGKKYSKAMKATIQNERGETVEMEMGCYGIGVGRTAAAAIEQNHDDRGIIWPVSIAPYHVHLVQLGVDGELTKKANEIYQHLLHAGVEVLLDDRDERAGVKLNDADLIGCPLRLMLGSRGLKNKEMELLPRNAQAVSPLTIPFDSDYVASIKEILGLASS